MVVNVFKTIFFLFSYFSANFFLCLSILLLFIILIVIIIFQFVFFDFIVFAIIHFFCGHFLYWCRFVAALSFSLRVSFLPFFVVLFDILFLYFLPSLYLFINSFITGKRTKCFGLQTIHTDETKYETRYFICISMKCLRWDTNCSCVDWDEPIKELVSKRI